MPWPFDPALSTESAPVPTAGVMELQMERHPWASTPVGPVAQWPFSLKRAVRTVLDCRLPTVLVWGESYTQFFNDAFAAIAGDARPDALGADVRTTWPQRWAGAGPTWQKVKREATFDADELCLAPNADGECDAGHYTCSYVPVYAEDGRVGGVLATLVDTTEKVLAERRRQFQFDLADILHRESDAAGLLSAACRHIGAHVDGATVTYADVQRGLHASLVREEWRAGVRTALVGHTVPFEALTFGMGTKLGCCITAYSLDVANDPCIPDGAAYAAGGIGAGIAVPLAEGGRMEAVLTLHHPAPQRWDTGTIRLVEDAGRRIWEALRRIRAEQALRDETRILGLMRGASETLASTIDLEALMQAITDAATGLTGAQFGAFFYNATDDAGESYQLCTLIGASRESVAYIDGLRRGSLLDPGFQGNGPVRRDDITFDPRYAFAAAREGAPPGHLPVRSYLAISVVSRSGAAIGGLVFGDARPAAFNARSEELISAFAVQAAIAIDNARLYDMAQRAASEREGLLASERAARAEAERHNKMKDEFLAMLAHELRNPLAPITSAAQLLRLPEVNEGLRLKASNIISRQVRHMTELVDDLLDVSRVTRGLVKLENEVLDLNKIAIAAVEQARPHIEERKHVLSVDLPADPVPVEGDRTRLVQVMVNLLNNSAKYTPAGGRITLDVVSDDGAARVRVRDNGVGIDAQLLPHIFDLFTQADRAPDRSQGGLGIGLALVNSIVRMHNGNVAAHSDGAGQGTLLTVTLPLAHAEVGQVVRSGEGSGEAHPLAITIVDDNADAGHSLAVLLRAHGHHVRVHEDAAGTLAATDTPTEVFILDIGLPDMTGYELAKRLRRVPRYAGALFVALTGYGQARDRELSRQAGFDHHLVKPVEIGKLTQILAEAAGRPPLPV